MLWNFSVETVKYVNDGWKHFWYVEPYEELIGKLNSNCEISIHIPSSVSISDPFIEAVLTLGSF